MTNKILSIIIPIYNADLYINSCISSLSKCKSKDIEFIFIDDGSDDLSASIISKFKKIDNRVKLFRKENGGVSSARNYGINVSTGKYIMFLDSDDEINYNIIDDIEKYIEYDSDLVIFLHEINNNGKISVGDYYNVKMCKTVDDILVTSILTGELTSSCAKLYKNDIIKKYKLQFKEGIKVGEDAIFVINYLKYITNYKFENKSIFTYHIHSNSAMTNFRNTRFNDMNELFNERLNLISYIAVEDSDILINGFYRQSFQDIISNIAHACKFISEKELNQTLSRYWNNDDWIEIFKNTKYVNLNLDQSVSLFLCKHLKMNIVIKYMYFRKIIIKIIKKSLKIT